MSDRPAVLALLAPLAITVVVALSGCMTPPAEVPADAVLRSETSAPTRTTAPAGTPQLGGDEMTRQITLCLARYGLGEQPPTPADDATAEERLVAQQKLDDYRETLTNCSAEAMGTSSPTPSP